MQQLTVHIDKQDFSRVIHLFVSLIKNDQEFSRSQFVETFF